MKKVTLHLNSENHHFSQLISGLEYLGQQKKIELAYNFDKGRYPENIFRVEVSGLNLFFDLADHSGINSSLHDESDFYVKRMLLKKDYGESPKLIPYGLYFPVYYQNSTLKYRFLKDPSSWKYSLKYWKALSDVIGIKDSIASNELNNIESDPVQVRNIIFRSRLWDAGVTHPQWKRESRKAINEQRIHINELMHEKFGNAYIGGIRKDAFSENESPELIISTKHFHRCSYLKQLRNASIGIATPGLEKSIGAKFGEYLANSLAIVTNPIDEIELLGPLEEEKHYLSYTSPEDCVEKTELLFSNDTRRLAMQRANQDYYKNWLHPGMKMLKIFERIGKL